MFHALVFSRLTYASPAWWGFASQNNKQKLQAVLDKAVRWGYYQRDVPSFEEICAERDASLFKCVKDNRDHVLHRLLPPLKPVHYSLRASTSHGRVLPFKHSVNQGRNFVFRMLYNELLYH